MGLILRATAPVFEEVYPQLQAASKQDLVELFRGQDKVSVISGGRWVRRVLTGAAGMAAAGKVMAWITSHYPPSLFSILALLLAFGAFASCLLLTVYNEWPHTRKRLQKVAAEEILQSLAEKLGMQALDQLINDPLTEVQSPQTARVLSRARAEIQARELMQQKQALLLEAQKAPALAERMRQAAFSRGPAYALTNACEAGEQAI